MKTIIALLLASCVVSFAQTNINNSDSTSDKITQLMLAAGSGDIKTIKFLLDKGTDINVNDAATGWTALMTAAAFNNTDTVQLLLDKGADINATNFFGETALMRAAEAGNTNVVKLLLARGGNFSAADSNGQTALDLAKKKGNTGVVQLLQQVKTTAVKPVNIVVAAGTNTDSSGYVTNAALLTPFTMTNSMGDVITNAVLVKLTANKLIYKTDAGAMGMLPLATLPEDLREKFGYDPQTAQAADEAEQAKKARQQQIVQQQQEIAIQQANVKAQSQSAVSDISSSIKAYAEKEFPDDYNMQEFVIKQQTEAYNWVVAASSATGVPQGVFDQIKAKAADEFPDDFNMQKFVINQQVKAYTDLH